MGKRRRRGESHPEGGHGPKTQRRIRQQLESGPSVTPLADRLAIDRDLASLEGKRRLMDRREQHDPSEKSSERTQLFDELPRGEG